MGQAKVVPVIVMLESATSLGNFVGEFDLAVIGESFRAVKASNSLADQFVFSPAKFRVSANLAITAGVGIVHFPNYGRGLDNLALSSATEKAIVDGAALAFAEFGIQATTSSSSNSVGVATFRSAIRQYVTASTK